MHFSIKVVNTNLPNVDRRRFGTGQSALPQLELLPEAFRATPTAFTALHVRLYLVPLCEKKE